MAKDDHVLSDTYGRGRANSNRGGAGAYTESNSEAMRKKGLGDAARKVDRRHAELEGVWQHALSGKG